MLRRTFLLFLVMLAAGALHADEKSKAKAALPALTDINSASAADLAKLPAIGVAKAAKIVQSRPYRGKDELVAKKILTPQEYDKVKDLIVARLK